MNTFSIGERVGYLISHEGTVIESDRHKKMAYGIVCERPKPQRKSKHVHKGVYVRFGEGVNAVYKNILPERLIKLTSELETA